MDRVATIDGTTSYRTASAIFAGVIGAVCAIGSVSAQNGFRPAPAIPNLAPSSEAGWLKSLPGDEFIAPDAGPGPVRADPKRPYVGAFNPLRPGAGQQETVKIADISNPILQPWVVEQMKKSNDEVLAGKVGFTARSRCWPHGVPGFLLYPVHPIFFIQSPKEVVMVWGQDFQMRRVFLDVPHTTNPKPSWYGESVGHYENGDTLVVDTIGLNDRTFVDNYRTPHTTALHVTERFTILNDGRNMEVKIHVEDPRAFTMPWNAIQRYRLDQRDAEVPLHEMVCAENNSDHFSQGLVPIPRADTPDF
jgi:hypothetical protein